MKVATAGILEHIKLRITGDMLFPLNEGELRGAIVRFLLYQGYWLQERSQKKNSYRQLFTRNDRVDSITIPGDSKGHESGLRTDIAIMHPVECRIELQVASRYACSDVVNNKAVVDDLVRVKSGFADLFILVCHHEAYLTAASEQHSRGRRRTHGLEVQNYFPLHPGNYIEPPLSIFIWQERGMALYAAERIK